MPGKKMMGYKKGGSLEMVEKDGKKVPFYAADGKGKMAEGGEVKKEKTKRKKPNVPGKLQSKSVQEKAAEAKLRKNNTSDAKPKTPVETAMQTSPAAGGGMGAMMKNMMGAKPGVMPKMKAGGKVKKKANSYGKGGKIRGCGIAKKGVRKAKMR